MDPDPFGDPHAALVVCLLSVHGFRNTLDAVENMVQYMDVFSISMLAGLCFLVSWRDVFHVSALNIIWVRHYSRQSDSSLKALRIQRTGCTLTPLHVLKRKAWASFKTTRFVWNKKRTAKISHTLSVYWRTHTHTHKVGSGCQFVFVSSSSGREAISDVWLEWNTHSQSHTLTQQESSSFLLSCVTSTWPEMLFSSY